MILSFQAKGEWSFGISDCTSSVVSDNYLENIAVVAFGGSWNCEHKHAIGGCLDRDNRDSIQICINLNPGDNILVDTVNEEKYFTKANAIACIERENVALHALKDSLKSFGFLDSSSSSSSCCCGGVVDYSPGKPKEEIIISSSSSSSSSSSAYYSPEAKKEYSSRSSSSAYYSPETNEEYSSSSSTREESSSKSSNSSSSSSSYSCSMACGTVHYWK